MKLKACPVCKAEAATSYCTHFACCSDRQCMLSGVEIPIDAWNSRPLTMGEKLREILEKLGNANLSCPEKGKIVLSADVNTYDTGAFFISAETPEEAVHKAWEEIK